MGSELDRQLEDLVVPGPTTEQHQEQEPGGQQVYDPWSPSYSHTPSEYQPPAHWFEGMAGPSTPAPGAEAMPHGQANAGLQGLLGRGGPGVQGPLSEDLEAVADDAQSDLDDDPMDVGPAYEDLPMTQEAFDQMMQQALDGPAEPEAHPEEDPFAAMDDAYDGLMRQMDAPYSMPDPGPGPGPI
jgi:hypothetical protein